MVCSSSGALNAAEIAAEVELFPFFCVLLCCVSLGFSFAHVVSFVIANDGHTVDVP